MSPPGKSNTLCILILTYVPFGPTCVEGAFRVTGQVRRTPGSRRPRLQDKAVSSTYFNAHFAVLHPEKVDGRGQIDELELFFGFFSKQES